MRQIFRRIVWHLKSDIERAIHDCTCLDPTFPARLDRAVAIKREGNILFNLGSTYTRFDERASAVRESIYGGAHLKMPEQIEGHWHIPTLAQALKRSVDGIIAKGVEYQTQEEIDIVDQRFYRARMMRERLDRRLAVEKLEPL